MNAFVDCGGNSADTVRRYLKKFPRFDQVYVFEPNPKFHPSYEGSGFVLERKAAWTRDCSLPLYLSPDTRQVASSLLREKLCKVGKRLVPIPDNIIEVECVDLSNWIKNLKADHITLKLDIEGAEYDVLWKMIKDRTIRLIDELYVEFHADTLARPVRHHALLDSLAQHGVTPREWN